MIANIGCSGCYNGIQKVSDYKPVVKPINVLLPTGEYTTSTHTRALYIPTFPPAACVQYLPPKIKSTGLLSIGQLCDHECTATFFQKLLEICNKREEVIIVGHEHF